MKNNFAGVNKLFPFNLVLDFKVLVDKGEIFRGKSAKTFFCNGCNARDISLIARSLEGNENPEAVKLLDAINKHQQGVDNGGESPDKSSPPAPASMVENTGAQSNRAADTPLLTVPKISSVVKTSPPIVKLKPIPDATPVTFHVKPAATAPMENIGPHPVKDPPVPQTMSAQPALKDVLPGAAELPEKKENMETEEMKVQRDANKNTLLPGKGGSVKEQARGRQSDTQHAEPAEGLQQQTLGTEQQPAPVTPDTGEFQWFSPDILKPHPKIKNLYKIDSELSESIKEIMLSSGYDTRYPIQAVIIDGIKYIWDGLTRHRAALDAGLKKVYVQVSVFSDEKELLLACVRNQALRRSNDDATVLSSIELLLELETLKAKERQKRKTILLGQDCPDKGSASLNIAKIVGKSETTVKHARKVLDKPKYKAEVLAGISINKAYLEIMAAEKDETMANENNEGSTQTGSAAPPQTESAKIPEPPPVVVALQTANPAGEQTMSQTEILADKTAKQPATTNQKEKPECEIKPTAGAVQTLSQLATDNAETVPNSVSLTPSNDDGNSDLPTPVMHLLVAMAEHIPNTAIPKIRGLLSKCDNKTITLIEQHLVGAQRKKHRTEKKNKEGIAVK